MVGELLEAGISLSGCGKVFRQRERSGHLDPLLADFQRGA
jgi:hypothetical protein